MKENKNNIWRYLIGFLLIILFFYLFLKLDVFSSVKKAVDAHKARLQKKKTEINRQFNQKVNNRY
ncbi:MAG: hypothetical protein ABIH00_04000 [Armatimonadota bacterium]